MDEGGGGEKIEVKEVGPSQFWVSGFRNLVPANELVGQYEEFRSLVEALNGGQRGWSYVSNRPR